MKTVAASLVVEMLVICPNRDCGYIIDLLREEDTDGYPHDDDGFLLRQMFPAGEISHEDFKCDDVVCAKCKTKFNVRELEW